MLMGGGGSFSLQVIRTGLEGSFACCLTSPQHIVSVHRQFSEWCRHTCSTHLYCGYPARDVHQFVVECVVHVVTTA